MSIRQESNIADSLLTIHDIITRGLKVSVKSAQGFSQRGFQDNEIQEGFLNYVRALVSILHAHHLTEDDLAFPYFRDKLPEAPFDLLIRQHQEMVHVLDEIKLAVEKFEQEGQVEIGLRDLKNSLSMTNEMWHPHIQLEQEYFIEKADELLPVEEQMRLVKQFVEHGQGHSGPPYLTVPFMLYNLPVDVREKFAVRMPAEVTGNLVPIVWKEQWQSMTPFLLE